MSTANPNEQLQKIEDQIAALKEKEKRIKARASQEKRKRDTHNKIVLGGAILSVLGRDYQEEDEKRLIAFLKSQDARGNYFSRAMNESAVPNFVLSNPETIENSNVETKNPY